jgi:hypothetical protein
MPRSSIILPRKKSAARMKSEDTSHSNFRVDAGMYWIPTQKVIC